MAKRGRKLGFTFLTPGALGTTFEGLGADWWIRVEGGDLSQPALVRLGRSPEGALVCTGLLLGAEGRHEVTARGLRDIRLAEVVSALAATAQRARRVRKPLPRESDSINAFYRALIGTALDDGPLAAPPKLRPGPRGHPREHFKAVAERYRRSLLLQPRAPIKALALELNASEATVRRWVQRARDMGFLGHSVMGKAGEAGRGRGRRA